MLQSSNEAFAVSYIIGAIFTEAGYKETRDKYGS
jgi:hypothetical protein